MSQDDDFEDVELGGHANSRGGRKTVIILGAGASAADGAPVQSELFRDYFRSTAIQGRVGAGMKYLLELYFRQIWDIDIAGNLSEVRFPTFEEALGIIDIADSRKESFRGIGDDPHGTATQEMRNHLTTLIVLILDEKLKDHYPNHVQLLRSLRGAGCLEQVVFISLNYDILIDNAIEDVARRHVEQRVPDYAVDFTPRPHSAGRPFPVANVLLKLHGSLNWLYCPTCNKLELFVHHKIAAEIASGRWRCSVCNGLQAPIIIPPTFFKVMSNFYLQQIWKRAEDELKKAARIVFCGYSFPDADMHIKYLLKRAEVNRPEGQAPPEVFIVNRPDDRLVEQHRENPERKRYERFFKDKDRVHWTALSFQGFAADPQLVEDRAQWL